MNKFISLLVGLFTLSNLCNAGTVSANFTSASKVTITAATYTATGNDVAISISFAPTIGTNLMIVKVTGLPFIVGRFSNLAHGQTVDLSYGGKSYRFVANYYGGSGNDLVLHWGYQDLAAWGIITSGQLGNNNTTNSSVPVLVTRSGVLAGKTVISVAARSGHSLALCTDGAIAAWGNNTSGQLGNNTTSNSSVPVLVTRSGVLSGKTVVSVAAGGQYHSLALCSDGALAAWGDNTSGQLGNNSTTNSSAPVLVTRSGVLSGKTVVSVAAGDSYSLALCSDGTLAMWGYSYGVLNNHSKVPFLISQLGALYGKTVVSIAAGGGHSLALCTDGTLAAWGNNTYGQLGDSSTIPINESLTYKSVPVLVTRSGVLAGKTVVSVAAGFDHSLALCSDGTLTAWGKNSSGQLGNNRTTSSSAPVLVTQSGVLSGKTVVSVAANLALASVANSGDLSGLSLSVGTLSPIFDPATTSYGVSVASGNSSITVTPTPASNTASISVNNSLVTSGSSSLAIPLNVGINLITIAVTAFDGVTIKTYTVSVTRVGSYDLWKENVFTLSERNDLSVSGDQASPAGDGITNLMKYALALEPKACGVGGLPTASAQDGYLTLTYRKNKQASDVAYTVLAEEGLSGNGWSEAITVVSQTDEGDYSLITVRDNVTQAGHPTVSVPKSTPYRTAPILLASRNVCIEMAPESGK